MAIELLFPVSLTIIALIVLFFQSNISWLTRILSLIFFLLLLFYWYGALHETIVFILNQPLPPKLMMLRQATDFALSGLLWLWPAMLISVFLCKDAGNRSRLLLVLHLWTVFILLLRFTLLFVAG